MIKIWDDTTKTPLQLMGVAAGTCWNGNIEDIEKNINRANDCIESNHGRVIEWPDIYCTIDKYSAKCLRELFTHIGGSPSRLQASTRYIDYEKGFETVLPKSIEKNNDATEVWHETIHHIKNGMSKLKALGVPKEDYTNLLPLAYESKMVWKINLRTLVNFMNKRLCARALWEIRNLANELKTQLSEYSPEWKEIADKLFVPQCEIYKSQNPKLVFCPESKGCGRYKNIKDFIVE